MPTPLPLPVCWVLLWQSWGDQDSLGLIKLLSQSCQCSGKEAQFYVGGCKEVKVLQHLGSSPLHCRVSIRIIHFCTEKTPASLWFSHEQVWVVIMCTVTSEQKGNLKTNHSSDLGGKMLCWFHCLPVVLGNSIAGVVSGFNSWIFFLPYFFQMVATDKLGYHQHVVLR